MSKPSVSKLIGLLDRPALLRWANQQGLKGIDIEKDKVRRLTAGSSKHKQIEDYWKLKIPFEDVELGANYMKFIQDKTIFQMENNIETNWFVGRYDAKIEIDNKMFICDFKSTKGVYFENMLQLVAYRMAEKCDGLAVIHVPTFNIHYLNIDDFSPYEEILKALSAIHFYKQKVGVF